MKDRIVLGSRGSDLALIQARMVETALRRASPDLSIETRIIRTRGDESRGSKRLLPAGAGRKGLFTAEIERALVCGDIDVAVHSAKDLPSTLAAETRIAATLPRAAVEDILVSPNGNTLASLPQKAVVATGSVRRLHQLQWQRPDVEIIDLRGNVPTRLRKLISEGWNGAILARAGLERLGHRIEGSLIQFENSTLTASVLPLDIFVPAGGQGVVALQTRAEDQPVLHAVRAVNDPDASVCLRGEREFLRLLHADCNQPVGVFAFLEGTLMKMRAQVFWPSGNAPRIAAVQGKPENAEQLAAELLRATNGE